MSQQRAAVLSSYRRLYRARWALFRGDVQTMTESRKVVRQQYLQHGTAPIADPQHLEGLLSMVDEAVDMLRHGIVRGDLNPKTGHYEVKLKKEHAETGTNQPPLVQPITPQVLEQMENKSQSSSLDDVKVNTTMNRKS